METVNLVILFCDIHGFSRLQAGMAPSDQASLIQEIYEILGECVVSDGGKIVKYLGDSLMAIFPGGAEVPAVKCALAMRRAFDDLLRRRGITADTGLETAVGSGPVVRGMFGHRSLVAMDVFGEVVNRVAVLMHYRGTAVTEEVAKAVSGSFRTEPLPDLQPKWMSTPLKAWRIVG
jgi:adenylate cyclase